MRRSFFLIFINAVILMMVVALLAQSIFIIKRLAKAESIKGHVFVQHNGRGTFSPLSATDFIKTNDVVRTESDGAAEFKWSDGTRLKVEPKTTLTIKKASYNMARKADESEFRLSEGTIYVRIVKALEPQSRFEVETPTAVAAVRGTIFMVKVVNGQTQVAVHRGQVKVKSSAENDVRESLITPGKVATSAKPGEVVVRSDSKIEKEFYARETIINPELSVKVIPDPERTTAVAQGRTEAGDRLTINGKVVKVWGNGFFRERLSIRPGSNQVTVVSTDKHGASRTVRQTVVGG